MELVFGVNTFFLLICGALVMWMAAGFAMLEAGLVRAKNTIEILTKNICLYATACLVYLLCGYYIMYVGNAQGGFFPSFGFLIGEIDNSTNLSYEANFFFQMVFVATALSIISGAVAERMKLSAFLIFSIVMCALIYPVEGYWVWGEGFLKALGFVDFAGSAVVHLAGATAALIGVLLLGPRKGKFTQKHISPIPGCNIPLATLGTFILWFGWFGFNGGSQLAIADKVDAIAVAQIFVHTNLAASSGALGAFLFYKLIFKKSDLTMILNGILGGLVAITADPLSPSLLGSVFIGLIAGILVIVAIISLDHFKIDDPVGAISVHGVCAIFGLFVIPLHNDEALLWVQLVGVISILAWVGLLSFATWSIIKKVMGIRVTEEEEYYGMDLIDCGLEAYPEFVLAKR